MQDERTGARAHGRAGARARGRTGARARGSAGARAHGREGARAHGRAGSHTRSRTGARRADACTGRVLQRRTPSKVGFISLSGAREQMHKNKFVVSDALYIAHVLGRALVEPSVSNSRLGDARLSHPITETLVLRDGDGKRTRAYRIWQERSRLPSIVAAEAVEAVLDDLVRAEDRAALVAAVANAEALGVRADPGSEELCSAKARVAELV